MTLNNRVVLAALFHWTIFTNLNPGLATVLDPEANAEITRINPELIVRPAVSENGTLVTSGQLISFTASDRNSYYPWVKSLETFVETHRTSDQATNSRRCDYDEPTPLPAGQFCHIDSQSWGPYCSAENNFGYYRSTPCVFLQLDTPSGWRPEFYNDTNSLPEQMPQNLRNRVANTLNTAALNTVWIWCTGDSPTDEENMGPILYYPRIGIPGYYYLNDDVEGYRKPAIAVHFERPQVGVLINITCKAWARNIEHNNSTLGGVDFSLLINE